MVSESEIEDTPIVVELLTFYGKWKAMLDAPIPQGHSERIEELKHKFSCFRIKSAYYHKNHARAGPRIKEDTEASNPAYEFPMVRQMRPRIGLLFTNTEGKARKNFISFMNKLSPQNKGAILHNFIKSLIPENIHIYIDQIMQLFQVQPTYHDLYMEVLYEIIKLSSENAKTLLEKDFKQFVEEEKYRIPQNILENLDHLDASYEQTEQLCEYVRWKKMTKAKITFYTHCIANQIYGNHKYIEEVLLQMGHLIDLHWEDHAIVDIYLDMALHAVKCIHTYYPKGISLFPNVADHYSAWDKKKSMLKPSSRFKVLDILESIRKK